MTAAAPTADQEDLLSLVLDSTSTEQLARQLATRTAEQCARMLHALKDFLSTLSRKAGVGAPKAHLAMLVAALETTPTRSPPSWTCSPARSCPATARPSTP